MLDEEAPPITTSSSGEKLKKLLEEDGDQSISPDVSKSADAKAIRA